MTAWHICTFSVTLTCACERCESWCVFQENCRLPVKDGVVLMGVFDETGTLPSGTFWASFEAPEDDCAMMNDDSVRLHPSSPGIVHGWLPSPAVYCA